MKKIPQFVVYILIGLLAGAAALFIFLRFSDKILVNTILGNSAPKTAASTTDCSSSNLTALAFETVDYLKSGDFDSLSEIVHPEYGVILSPYATVNLSSNQCFSREQVAGFSRDNQTYIWGVTDGEATPIEMTVKDYFARYVLDYDYSCVSFVGIDNIIKSGNSLENVNDIFPDAHFVDLHYPGTAEAEYNDWSTLRLVFENYNGNLLLTAIIHSQFTL